MNTPWLKCGEKPTEEFKEEHNVHFSTIRPCKLGLTARFISNKMSTAGDPIKHRTVLWSKLPEFARLTVEVYTFLHKGEYFFCNEDGQPLTRNNVLDLLEPCLLHTSFIHLNLMLHCFRQGHVSQGLLEDMSISDLKHECRWTRDSSAFEAYAKTDLIQMKPSVIDTQFKHLHKKRQPKRLLFISNHLIQTKGAPTKHVHHQMLLDEFPEQFKKNQALPAISIPSATLPCTYVHSEEEQNIRCVHSQTKNGGRATLAELSNTQDFGSISMKSRCSSQISVQKAARWTEYWWARPVQKPQRICTEGSSLGEKARPEYIHGKRVQPRVEKKYTTWPCPKVSLWQGTQNKEHPDVQKKIKKPKN